MKYTNFQSSCLKTTYSGTFCHVIRSTSARAVVWSQMNSKDVQVVQGQQLVQRFKLSQQVAVGNQASVLAAAPVTSKAVNVHVTINSQPQPDKRRKPAYIYKVKVINPSKKSDAVLRHLNGHTVQFESITQMKMKLIEKFGDQVPSQLDFSVGYYDGSQQAKTWLVTRDDLDTLYRKYPNGGNVALWCDGRSTDNVPKRKRELDSQPGGSYRQGKEEETEKTTWNYVRNTGVNMIHQGFVCGHE